MTKTSWWPGTMVKWCHRWCRLAADVVNMRMLVVALTLSIVASGLVTVSMAEEVSVTSLASGTQTSPAVQNETCLPYLCFPYDCNPYDCFPYECHPFNCRPYACNFTICDQYPCEPYDCEPYDCEPYACNFYNCHPYDTCTTVNVTINIDEVVDANETVIANATIEVYENTTCITQYETCNETCYNNTCYNTCYETCNVTCNETCYETCYLTCYNTCYNTCYEVCNYTCFFMDTHSYTYTAPLSHRVALVVQDSVGVCEDRLTIYDGTSTSDPPLLEKCSGYTGLTISTGNQLFFQFDNQRVDNNVSDTIGYSLRYFGFDPYGNPDPAQTFFSSDFYGSLYPNTFPGTYDATADIFWIVKAPCMSYLITGALFFADFHNCDDQLILRDGNAATSAELVMYCTDLTQNPDQSEFNTSQQYLYVQLSATSNGSYHGFALKYRWIPNPDFVYTTPVSTCSAAGTQFTAYCPFMDQVLQSPNYGGKYSSNEHCEYLITVEDDGYRVRLDFTYLDMENSTYCLYDVLTIYDGTSVYEPLRLNTLCGVDLPPPIFSSGKDIRLVFKTDDTLEFYGFQLTYSIVNSTYPACYADFEPGRLNATKSPQFFSSTNYPADYLNNWDEYWWIHNPEFGNKTLSIEILDIRIESANHCKYDKIMIYSGPCTTDPIVETYCHNYRKTFTFTGSADYLIRLHTDRVTTHRGFRIKYLIYDETHSTGRSKVEFAIINMVYSVDLANSDSQVYLQTAWDLCDQIGIRLSESSIGENYHGCFVYSFRSGSVVASLGLDVIAADNGSLPTGGDIVGALTATAVGGNSSLGAFVVDAGSTNATDLTTITTTVPPATNGPQYEVIVKLVQEQVTDFNVSNYWHENIPMKDLTIPSPAALDFYLTRLYDIDEINSMFKVAGYFSFKWMDEMVKWPPDRNNNVTQFYIYQSDIWRPDLVHINSLNESHKLGYNSAYAVVTYQGNITWKTQEILKSVCEYDLSHFPFDEHTCHIKMRTWSTSTTNLDLVQGTDKFQLDERWSTHSEWSLVEITSSSETSTVSGSTFTTFTYSVKVKRNGIYQIYNFIAPFIIIGTMNIFGFILPIKSKEKARFCIVLFLIVLVHLIVTIKKIPQNSQHISTFAIYSDGVTVFSAVIACVSMCLMRIAHKSVNSQKMGAKMQAFTKNIKFIRKKLACGLMIAPRDPWRPWNHPATQWHEAVSAIEFVLFWLFLFIYAIFTAVLLLQIFVYS